MPPFATLSVRFASLRRPLVTTVFALLAALAAVPGGATSGAPMAVVDTAAAEHPGKTGVYVLDSPVEALLARAWLADHAQHSIEIQYFIWSSDNIGILAAEALLRAANRGVRVRVLVDDLMIDAPDQSLLALAQHPNIDIRVYNPLTSVGVPLLRRMLNVVTQFRAVNQRMHDKTVIVDGKVAITGGRNMAAEYFDYNRRYNFRDRDVLLLGHAVAEVRASFERFWDAPLAAPVETLYDGLGLMQKNVRVTDAQVQAVYRWLHDYARDPSNFAPEVRTAIADTPQAFARVAAAMVWADVEFVSDLPGKNDGSAGLDGGGRSTAALARLLDSARERVVIQSPYLVLSDPALALVRGLRRRGVDVLISTNSLASTDNLLAFSGYRRQRAELLALGVRIREYRPDAAAQRRQMEQRLSALPGATPIFSLHAKSIVVDGAVVAIGTFNLDPRSENLNTEVAAIVKHAPLAARVETAILEDAAPENSWDPATTASDRLADWRKLAPVRLLQWLPLRPLL